MNTSCPDETTLAALADATLPGDQRIAAIRHVADCEACIAALGMLTRMHGKAIEVTVPESLLARASAASNVETRWYIPAAAAAVLAITSSVLLYPIAHRLSTVPLAPALERSKAPVAAAVSHVAVVVPRENGPMPEAIRWTPIVGATGYLVSITHEDGSLVWQARSDNTVCPVTATIEPGRAYFVLVRAFLPGGRAVTSRAIRTVAPTR